MPLLFFKGSTRGQSTQETVSKTSRRRRWLAKPVDAGDSWQDQSTQEMGFETLLSRRWFGNFFETKEIKPPLFFLNCTEIII